MKTAVCWLSMMVILNLSVTGCASGSKATSQPAPSQTRSDSDRFFEKMKQEERERGTPMDGSSR